MNIFLSSIKLLLCISIFLKVRKLIDLNENEPKYS